MAIPNGTKFHGVAPSVDTENRGSASLNAKRDVYTYPDDFGGSKISVNGTFVNFGASGGGADILGGSSVDFGVEQNTATDHFPFYIVPTSGTKKVTGVAIQWGSTTDYQTARGSSTVTFKVSQCTFGVDVTDVNNWGDIGTLTTEWDGTSGTHPGFLEEVDFPFTRNLIQVTAVASSGFGNTGEEVEITLIIE
eukprot:COSAG01_NODE_1329_length_10704_cov_34.202074_10_plen_193_part_00